MPNITWTAEDLQALAYDDGGLSPELCEAMSLPESDDGLIVLIKLSHPELEKPICVSSWAMEFFHLDEESKEPVHGLSFQGESYIFCPFSLSLFSEEEGGELQTATISIANVDDALTKQLRTIPTALDFKIMVVSRKDTQRVQLEIDHIKLTSATITKDNISGQLSDYDYGAEPVTPNYTLAEYRMLV